MTDTRHYGYRYAEIGEHPTAAQIAKAIRADVKQAVTEGLLPGKPVTYSVRSQTFSGGCSIDITVKGWPEVWIYCDGNCTHWNAHGYPHRFLNEDGEAAKMTLERIHNAYNHDGSDIQTDYFDVRYYGGVDWDWRDTIG